MEHTWSTVTKFLKTTVKEKYLKVAGEKRHVTYRGTM